MAPSFRSGKTGYFSLTSATGGTINYSSGINSVSYERSADALNVTTFGDSDDVLIAGLRGGSISVSGLFASTYEEKLSALLGHSTTPQWIFGPESTSNTRRKLSGGAILTGFSIGASVEDAVQMSFSLAVSGAVTSTTF